jgi:hypothetical protein
MYRITSCNRLLTPVSELAVAPCVAVYVDAAEIDSITVPSSSSCGSGLTFTSDGGFFTLASWLIVQAGVGVFSLVCALHHRPPLCTFFFGDTKSKNGPLIHAVTSQDTLMFRMGKGQCGEYLLRLLFSWCCPFVLTIDHTIVFLLCKCKAS